MLVTTDRIGRQLQKRAVALVGFGDQVLRLSEARVRSHGVDAAADHHGRIEAARGQHGCHHRSRRRLAVHAGDGDAVLQPHQLGQHFGALNHRNVQLVGFGDFGILRGNRGTGDHHFGAGDVFGAMSLKDRGAQTGQPLRHGGTLQVGAGNFVAEIEQHLGNAAHADAADAYEMNALNFCEHKINFLATDSSRIRRG